MPVLHPTSQRSLVTSLQELVDQCGQFLRPFVMHHVPGPAHGDGCHVAQQLAQVLLVDVAGHALGQLGLVRRNE